MGKKYVIELEDEPLLQDSMSFGSKLYRVKGFSNFVFDEKGLRKLSPYDETAEKGHIRDEGYKAGYLVGLSDGGEEEGWQLAKKLCWETCIDDLTEMGFFEKGETTSACKVLEKYTAKEAREKLESYKKDLKPGDEVTYPRYPNNRKSKAVVTRVEKDIVTALDSSGSYVTGSIGGFEKTGIRHHSIVGILDLMKEEEANEQTE